MLEKIIDIIFFVSKDTLKINPPRIYISNFNYSFIIDNEIYIKPTIENELIYGLVSNVGLKIYDLPKKETKSILYPGKKHIINDYFISNGNIIKPEQSLVSIMTDMDKQNQRMKVLVNKIEDKKIFSEISKELDNKIKIEKNVFFIVYIV